MRFALTSEQQAMAAALRELLSAADVPASARDWATDDTAAWHRIWRDLTEMGVAGLIVPEQHGGLGMGAVELARCLEELGYAGLSGPVVETIAVLPRLLEQAPAGAQWLPTIASGQAVGTVVFAEHVPYALDADVASVVFRCESSREREQCSALTDPGVVRQVSADPTRRLYSVSGSGTLVENAPVRRAFDYGVLGCAAQLLGIGRRLLDLSVEHAYYRQQFGRPIGQFQAVKHHVANVAVQLEFARPLLYAACLSLEAGAEHGSRDVSTAKIALSDAARLAARTAIQVHGAIGYTVEHDLHLWLTKATALHSAWATTSWHRGRVADEIATDPTVTVGETA